MKYNFLLLKLILAVFAFSQNTITNKNLEPDENYREDQFYVSVTYNLIGNKPNGVSQSGFSSGFHFGFIRDMPINKKRNLAIAAGLGVSSNSYNQNMRISQSGANDISFSIIDESQTNVTKNKFTTYLLEFPVEFRWRTSTTTDYNFWRIYPGFKLGYVLYNSTKFNSDSGNEKLSNIDNFNKLQYGFTLSAGYGTWNFHVYYGLNSIFDNSMLSQEIIDMQFVKIGLMVYIL